MKQSTKLLSLVLALIMAFSCMSVIGSAASTIDKATMVYDSVDDAALLPEQVGDIALDLIDGLLADANIYENIVDLGFLGALIIDLRSVDQAFSSLYETANGGIFTIAKGLAGDVADLSFTALANGSTPYKRGTNGNLTMLFQLLQFLADNAGTLKKAVNGIGTDNGISLGVIGGLLGNTLGDINEILTDIPGMVKGLVFDLLIYGSYGYDKDSEELGTANIPFSTVESMLDAAVAGLLSNPQQYDMVGEGDAAVKVWNEKSLLLPSVAAYDIDVVTDYFSISGNDVKADNNVDAQAHTVFQLLDKAAPFAIYDLGVGALNNNLKKALMEAVEADLNEINKKDLPEDVKTAFEVDKIDETTGQPVKPGEESYVTYIAYDKMVKSGDDWYYTTLENEVEVDPVTKEPVLDEEGNEQTTKERKYFKINLAVANEFADLINWEWNIIAPVPLSRDYSTFTYKDVASNEIDYTAMINEYGSLVESLNDIIGIVYDNALTSDIRTAFERETGNGWVKGKTSEKINDNLTRLLKYLLGEYGHKIFGEDSAYAGLGYDYFKDMTIIDIVALIGPEFFKDVMPQLIIPQNADGSYAFAESDANGSSAAFLQFGALVIREFMTEIAPNVNYDAYIFEAGSLTSGAGRQFNTANGTEDWFNIILNMGMDIAYTYLYQLTNFGDSFDYSDDGKAFTVNTRRTTNLPAAPADRAEAVSETRWKNKLNDVIVWGANYVGQGDSGVISALSPNAITNAYSDPLDRLSYVLNTILPLGFINGLEDSNFDASVSVLFTKLKTLLTKMDFTQLTSLFGRNGVTANGDTSSLKKGNILDKPIIPMALGLVNDILNLVFRVDLLDETSLTANLQNGSGSKLESLVQTLLTQLNVIKKDLLINAAPVLAKFIKGWGTEQEFDTPSISLDRSVVLVDGATKDGDGNAINYVVNVSNGANGIWRSWADANGQNRQQDEQYQIKMTGVTAKDYDGNTSSKVSIASFSTDFIPFGESKTFEYSATGISNPGEIVRFDVSYQVYEGTTLLSDEVFTQSIFSYLNYNDTDAAKLDEHGSKLNFPAIRTPHYVPLSTAADYIKTIPATRIKRDQQDWTNAQQSKFTAQTATVDGITFGNTGEISLTNSDWSSFDIRNFDTYTAEHTSSDSDKVSINVAGGVDEAAWKAAGKTPGSKTEFKIDVYNNKADTTTATKTLTLIYYDDVSLSSISSIANNEVSKGRVKADYKQSGYTYVPGEMITADGTVDGVEVFKETNATLVWIDENENEVAEGTAGAIKAMRFDNAQVWATYEAAFKKAVQEAYGVMMSTRDFTGMDTFLKELEIAVHDIEYTKDESTGDTGLDAKVAALKTSLKNVEATYTNDYDYTDYRMYRLNRLNDAREEAQYLINLQNDASNANVDEIDETFPYTWIEEDDLRALVAYDSDLTNLKKDDVNIVTALLEKLDEEEIKAKEEWLENKKVEYGGKTALDVAMASSLLTKTSTRLLDRNYKSGKNAPDTYYLQTEVTSAQKEIGLVNEWEEDNEWGEEPGTPKYSDRSWTKYINAYNNAVDVLNGTNGAVKSQKNAFDAKWELLCCRNELVLYFDEADYSQLETLMAQAKYALNNMNLYSNEAADLGKVLAELGVVDDDYKLVDITNADGNAIDLFPGSAAYVNTEPYSYLDQDVVDQKCTELKEALARLKFKGLDITATDNIVVDDEAILEEGNEAEGIDAVTTTIARIAAGLDAETVKTFFNVTADGNLTVSQENITVSNDLYYTVDTDLEGLVGTNSVVTFYTVVDEELGIRIPVATVKIVVDGDINGDGAVDAIDGAQAHLVNADLATLEGCYLLAGDLDGTADRKIEDADYIQVINNIFGKEVKTAA